MALMSYKCPNCGGGLVFDPDSQKFQCEYCLSEFTEEEMKRMEEASAFPAKEEKAVLEEEGTAPQEGDSSQSPETGEAAVYTCPSCGAQIVTDATTAASFCYYCHNPVVFSPGTRSKSCRGSTSLTSYTAARWTARQRRKRKNSAPGSPAGPGTQSIKGTRWNGRVHWKLKI